MLLVEVETKLALLLRKMLRRFFSAGASVARGNSSPGYEGGTMTSCSWVVVRMKVNSGMGFGRFGKELELVLRVLVASPWMLERFLSTSRSGMVEVGMEAESLYAV